MDRLADDGGHVHRRPAHEPAPRRSSCSTRGPARCRGPTTSASCCRTPGGCSPSSPTATPTSPGIHFGIGCDHLLEAMHAAGPRRHRPRLAHVDRRRPPAPRRRPRRAGQPRPGARARRRRAGARRRPARCWPTTPVTPATSSTSATACTRRPTPACWRRSSSSSTSARRWRDDRRASLLMAYGTPRTPDEIAPLLHRHPPRPAADGRAARRPDPPLRGDRRRSPRSPR